MSGLDWTRLRNLSAREIISALVRDGCVRSSRLSGADRRPADGEAPGDLCQPSLTGRRFWR